MSMILPHIIAFFQGVGPTELVIILLVLLLLFGGRKLPELARGIGKSIKEFRKASQEVEESFHTAVDKEKKQDPPKETEEQK